MKKIIILILLVVSTNVFAEWTEVGDSVHAGSKNVTSYADLETIKKKGHKVKMWILYDFKTAQNAGNVRYLSAMIHNEYDCEEETLRILDLHTYLEGMGYGGVVYSETNIKYEAEAIRPGTIEKGLFKIACGKK